MHRSYPARMVMLAASPRAPGALPCLRACTRCGGPAGRLPENIGVSIARQVLDELLSAVTQPGEPGRGHDRDRLLRLRRRRRRGPRLPAGRRQRHAAATGGHRTVRLAGAQPQRPEPARVRLPVPGGRPGGQAAGSSSRSPGRVPARCQKTRRRQRRHHRGGRGYARPGQLPAADQQRRAEGDASLAPAATWCCSGLRRASSGGRTPRSGRCCSA